jgi:DNA-binding transcriptional ArsR family regulator
MSTVHHPAKAEIELPAVLHALSDPHRLQIVRVLDECDDARRCGSFGLTVTKSTATHHFRVLREAGVITQVEDGRFPGLLDAILAAAQPAEPLAPVI